MKRDPNAPVCRACGKTIAKRFSYVLLTTEPPEKAGEVSFFGSIKRSVPKLPTTKEEAQPLFNQVVRRISPYLSHINDGAVVPVSKAWTGGQEMRASRSVQCLEVQIWDGESYQDRFFCKDGCAAEFGRAAARQYHERGYGNAPWLKQPEKAGK